MCRYGESPEAVSQGIYSEVDCEVRLSLVLGRLRLLLQFSRPLSRMLTGLSSAFAYFSGSESVLKRTEGESSWERNSKSLTCNCSCFFVCFFRSRHFCESSRSFQRVARLRASPKTAEDLPRSRGEARHLVAFPECLSKIRRAFSAPHLGLQLVPKARAHKTGVPLRDLALML